MDLEDHTDRLFLYSLTLFPTFFSGFSLRMVFNRVLQQQGSGGKRKTDARNNSYVCFQGIGGGGNNWVRTSDPLHVKQVL